MEDVAASHLNKGKGRNQWPKGSFQWDCVGADTDVHLRARLCAEHTMAGLAVSQHCNSYHYSSDKGYAGTLFVSILTQILKWMGARL